MNKKIIAIIVMVALVCGFIGYTKIHHKDVTSDDGFAKYSREYLDDTRVYGDKDGHYAYSSEIEDNVGFATCLEETDYDFVQTYRDYYCEKIKNKIEPDDAKFQAAFVNSALSYITKQKTLSMIMSYSIVEVVDDEVVETDSGVKTITFDKSTGKALEPEQILNEDYRDFVTKYMKKQLKGKKRHLVEGYKDKVSNDYPNFSRFMATNDGLVFVFAKGEVFEESEGVVTIEMPADECQQFMREEILQRYVNPHKKMVALTYDDGPGGKAEKKIQKLLAEHGAVATFFYSGYMMKNGKDQMRNALEIGCEIGNHTWNHPVLTKCDKDDLKKQLGKTSKKIEEITGQPPTLFRPSYGATNKKINKKSKLPVILWDIDTRDWESRDANKIFKKVTKAKHLDRKVILMHSLYPETAKATEKLLPWLEDHGYQTVTVTELIRVKYGEEPQNGKSYFGWSD